MLVAAAQIALRFFESPDDFAMTVEEWTARAKDAGAQLLVFPEDIGLPLVCIDDYELASQATAILPVAKGLIRRYWPAILGALFKPGFAPRRAIFCHKAARMQDIYTRALSLAARRHEMTLVAGSIPLPAYPGDPHVYNTSMVFDPQGNRLGVARKVDLVDIESAELGLNPGSLSDLPVFTSPVGAFGVAICLDSWNQDIAKQLVEQGAELIASPQANPLPWTDEEKTANREGLFAQCQELGVYGIQAMGVGELAGLKFEGQSAIFAPRSQTPDGSGIIAEAASGTGEQLIVGEIGNRALA